jgi:hypothetical protein
MVPHLNEEKVNFEDAVTKFQDFLRANGYPGEVVWVQPDDVLLTGKRLVYVRVSVPNAREKIARQIYEEGMGRRRGVLFGTICELGGTTCSYVWAPESDDEAGRALMPVGMKMNTKNDKIRGVSVMSGVRWAYLRVRYSGKQVLRGELSR